MKNKGFTLIELLGVIAILAILVIIAVPAVLEVFSEAKNKKFVSEVRNIIDAAEQAYGRQLLEGNVQETTYIYDSSGNLTKTGNIDLELTGDKIKNATIHIRVDGRIKVAMTNGKFCVIKEYDTKELIITEEMDECEIK